MRPAGHARHRAVVERQAHRRRSWRTSNASTRASAYLAECGNPPTPAWPGFKLAWLRDNDPAAYSAARAVLMPKDYINFRLTGEIAMDSGDASCSFLMNPRTRRLVARR